MTHSTDRTSATPPRARAVGPAVVAWVVESCERQGVPVKVTDAAVVARIGILLGSPDVGSPPKPARNRSEGDDGTVAA